MRNFMKRLLNKAINFSPYILTVEFLVPPLIGAYLVMNDKLPITEWFLTILLAFLLALVTVALFLFLCVIVYKKDDEKK